MKCYKEGLKSTYYLRNKPASKIQSVTSENDKSDENDQAVAEFQKKLEAARLAAENGEVCEMCQG